MHNKMGLLGQGIMSAATEVHAMVCNSVAPTCPVEVVCDAISLIATSLTTVAVDKVRSLLQQSDP